MVKLLSEQLKEWRAERPDEWKMDEFIREAKALERGENIIECKGYGHDAKLYLNTEQISHYYEYTSNKNSGSQVYMKNKDKILVGNYPSELKAMINKAN